MTMILRSITPPARLEEGESTPKLAYPPSPHPAVTPSRLQVEIIRLQFHKPFPFGDFSESAKFTRVEQDVFFCQKIQKVTKNR